MQIESEVRCASRSEAGTPAIDLSKLGRNVVFEFEKVNENRKDQNVA